MKKSRKYLLLFSLPFLLSCKVQEKKKLFRANQYSEEFEAYWYAGEAEVSSYQLSQARYGELHEGEAVLVFVTEDFLVKEQVKKEQPTEKEASSVLKLNFIRKFPTGIYDYSLMTSIFTPIFQDETSPPLKLSTSSQEWCGHSWFQLNRSEGAYVFHSASYFEQEGDRKGKLGALLLEDALWTQIRLNPAFIPEGKQELLPGSQYLRFAHKEIKAYEGVISKGEYKGTEIPGEQLNLVKVEYPELNRSLEIVYEKAFPHAIVGWKERRLSGFGAAARELETIAIRKAVIKSPYWEKNKQADAPLREELKLN